MYVKFVLVQFRPKIKIVQLNIDALSLEKIKQQQLIKR